MNAKGKLSALVYLQNSGADADTDVDGCGYGCRNVEVHQLTETDFFFVLQYVYHKK